MAKRPGHVRITDVSVYPNLSPSLGQIIGCQIEEQGQGYAVYHVTADSLLRLGCDLEGDLTDFPFYAGEVEVMNEG